MASQPDNSTQKPPEGGAPSIDPVSKVSQQNVAATNQQSAVQQPAAQQTTQAPVKPPKKKFPKKILLIIPFLFLLVVFIYLVFQLRPGGLGLPSIGKKGEIMWWGFWEESVVVPLISAYEEQSNIKINYVNQSKTDYRERLTNSLARGQGPDIFHFHNTWVPMFTNELEPAPTDVISAPEFSANYYPVIRNDLLKENRVLGVPLGFDALTLFINEDLFAAAGVSSPVTWDEFRILAARLTTKDRDRIIQSGAAIGRTENIDHWQEILGLMMLQNGVDPAQPTGQLAEDAVKFYTVFAVEDKVWDETFPVSTIAFANSKVAMYFGPSYRAVEIRKINPNLRFKTVPLPQLRKDDPTEPDVSYANYWAEGVWNKSANKRQAWEFLAYLSQRQQLEILYENLSEENIIGEPYPRLDMANLLSEDAILGSVVALAPQARSWYLADHTNDGPTGINSQLEILFKQVVDNVVLGREASRELNGISSDVVKVLSQYGIRTRSIIP